MLGGPAVHPLYCFFAQTRSRGSSSPVPAYKDEPLWPSDREDTYKAWKSFFTRIQISPSWPTAAKEFSGTGWPFGMGNSATKFWDEGAAMVSPLLSVMECSDVLSRSAAQVVPVLVEVERFRSPLKPVDLRLRGGSPCITASILLFCSGPILP